MKRIIIILCCFICVSFNYQNEFSNVIQKALDFEVLRNHIDSLEIINKEAIQYVRDNGKIDSKLNLFYNNRNLEFNDGSGLEGFQKHWSFEFLKVKIKRKKAFVTYKYIPRWNNCNGTPYIGQDASLYFIIYLEFKPIKEDWEIVNYDIQDINFDNREFSKAVECIKNKYKPL